ncbi:MAG: SDR family NAD(P)-dependent oxidoreductase [Dehalococcoidia bacterium]
MGKMEGHVALVTKSGNGIGRGTALFFASEGAFVVVADSDVKGGEETVRKIQEAGGEAVFIETDVSRISEIEVLTKKITEEYGQLDAISYC